MKPENELKIKKDITTNHFARKNIKTNIHDEDATIF